MKTGLLLLSLFAMISIGFAQANPVSDSLQVFNERIRVAKLSKNNTAVLKAYFDNTLVAISTGISVESFQKLQQFIREGIDFATSMQDEDHASIGYTRLATILRKRNEVDKAIDNAWLAVKNHENIQSDSIKAIAYIELGDCYNSKSELVEASKNFNKAFDLALKSKNLRLESNISIRLSNLYVSAGDTVEAKRHIYNSISINRKIGFGEGLIQDYTMLGRTTDNTSYLDTVFVLADSLGLQHKTLSAKNFLLINYGFIQKDPQKALRYIQTNKDVRDNILAKGQANYNWYIGQLYRYGNMPDSGLHYLKLAEPKLNSELGISLAQYLYMDLAICYQLKRNWKQAIYYYEKTLGYSRNSADRLSVSDSLSKIYNQTGQYQKAYAYKLEATALADTLASLAKGKDLVLLDLGRERKKHDDELRQAEERLRKKHNLQYMGITIGICILFLAFLVLGMFRVSKLVIRIFGFIYFICVFEFIILLLEHSVLHPITHGDPLKLWSLKIVLIALLVPFQQFLEHKLIHYLQSRKLQQARTEFMGKYLSKKKKPAMENDSRLEIDTGLL